MRIKFYSLISLLALSMGFSMLHGQSPRQIILVNGGNFSDTTDHTTVAAWYPQTGNYLVFDTIWGSSVQDVLIEGNAAYVAADGQLYKYDIDNYVLEHSAPAPGVRSLAVAPNQSGIVAACGFPATSDYVRLYDQSDLNEVGTIANISGDCQGVTVLNDTAYVTVPGPFGSTVGKVALVDLNALSLIAEIDLDTLGESVGSIFYRSDQNMFYTLNSLSFGSTTSVISQFGLGARNAGHFVAPFSMGYNGGTALVGNRIYGIFDNAFNSVKMDGFNPFAITNAPMIAGFWAGSAMDVTNKEFYLSETDYATYGILYRFDSTGTMVDSVHVGVSPEAFDIDSRLASSTNEWLSEEIFITTYPNPFTERITVDVSRLKVPVKGVSVFDFSGRQVYQDSYAGSQVEINLSFLPSGSYLVRVHTSKGDYAQLLQKQ